MNFSECFKKKFLSATLLSAVLFSSLFGVFFCSEMMMDMGSAQTSICNRSMVEAACPMGLVEHLSGWFHLLEAVLATHVLSLLIAVLLVFISLLGISNEVGGTKVTARLYLRNHHRYRLYNYFVALFAQGILQPKLLA